VSIIIIIVIIIIGEQRLI